MVNYWLRWFMMVYGSWIPIINGSWNRPTLSTSRLRRFLPMRLAPAKPRRKPGTGETQWHIACNQPFQPTSTIIKGAIVNLYQAWLMINLIMIMQLDQLSCIHRRYRRYQSRLPSAPVATSELSFTSVMLVDSARRVICASAWSWSLFLVHGLQGGPP